ncbi:hypothetical protein ACETU7_11680 [Rhodococcus sp. 3Y1]
MSSATSLTQVANFRWHRHQLDRAVVGDADHSDCSILDLGIQNTGPDGAAWALRIRGVRVDATELALAWTLRGAPTITVGATCLPSPPPRRRSAKPMQPNAFTTRIGP